MFPSQSKLVTACFIIGPHHSRRSRHAKLDPKQLAHPNLHVHLCILHMCIQRPLTSGIPPVLYEGRWIWGAGSFRAVTVTSPSDGLERTCYLVFYLVDYLELGATKSSSDVCG